MTSGGEFNRDRGSPDGSPGERTAEDSGAVAAPHPRQRLESGELNARGTLPGPGTPPTPIELQVIDVPALERDDPSLSSIPTSQELSAPTNPSQKPPPLDFAQDEEDSAPPSIPSAASLRSVDVMSIDAASEPKRPAVVLPGHVIADRYEVLSVLGEGGMGIVYRSRDQTTNELVAIKRVIPPEGRLQAEYVLWFYKEARALATLDHPAIVRARDFGQLVDGSPFLAMDLASGVSLHELAQVRLSFPLIWSVVDQVLGALAHAHARGVVHGDLKPSNVLVEQIAESPPRIHILDFGLAWLKQDPHDERLDGTKAMEFAPHAGAGTPGYMAPEQIQHEMHHVCGATDLYALGCILYRVVSGRSPFIGDPKELLKLHAFDRVPEPKLTIDAPPGVVPFIVRMLAKRPWDRWEFAAEARSDWAAFRPSDVAPSAYAFPTLRRASQVPPAPSTRKTGTRSPNPALAPAPQRAPGLLSMRPPPIVGRDELRRMLRETCDEVAQAAGSPHRLILLVGPAGVGKSRICEWLCEAMHEQGSMVPLRARYRPMRGPLDGMLGAATHYLNFERADRETIERSLLERWKVRPDDKTGRAWVAGASEWLRPFGPGSDSVGPSGVRFTLDTLDIRRMVIRYTLRRIANGKSLLFWLDDLHHATSATFEGLLRIHSDEPDIRIVMLCTVRSEDVQLGTPAAERLRELREKMDGAVIEVKAMDAETTCSMLRESLPLDETAVREAARRSRGNPLFALQQLHAWALAGEMEFKNGVYKVAPEVLAVRPQTTAELWDSRVGAMPEQHRLAAFAAATLGIDIRRNVLHALLSALGLPADDAILSMQSAELILPSGPGRYSWPHALLMEHLIDGLDQRGDRHAIFRASADALAYHPLAGTRRLVRQRVANLLHAGEADAAGALLFNFLEQSWHGAREPLATLADLELLKGQLAGRSLALKHRWQAEALRHVGRTEEAMTHAEIARTEFEELGDQVDLAHCLRLIGHVSSERGASAEGLMLVNLGHQLFHEQRNISGMAQCEAVAGEIEYLLGNYESARQSIEAGESHFETLDQPLGRGQCLLLLSWIDHSEGATERSRRLTLEARAEFARAGYRLGAAQADASLAHVEHRLMNFYNAELGALEALAAFGSLRTPRGQAACERLLAMIGIDTDDLDMADLHAERALDVYQQMGDPWGVMESKLLMCQSALARGGLERARDLLDECSQIPVEEAEPRQHYLLTHAWLLLEAGDPDRAYESIEAASEVFGPRSRAGDHTPHLLGRLARLPWPAHALERMEAWRALLNDRARRRQE